MREPIPIACSLPIRQAASQVAEWTDLHADVVATRRLEDGLEVTYAPQRAREVEDLVLREAACCAWLDLSTAIGDQGITVRLRSSNADALPVIQMLAVGEAGSR